MKSFLKLRKAQKISLAGALVATLGCISLVFFVILPTYETVNDRLAQETDATIADKKLKAIEERGNAIQSVVFAGIVVSIGALISERARHEWQSAGKNRSDS